MMMIDSGKHERRNGPRGRGLATSCYTRYCTIKLCICRTRASRWTAETCMQQLQLRPWETWVSHAIVQP